MPAETVFVEEGKHPMGRFARAEGLPDGGSMFDGGPHFPQVCAHLFLCTPRAQSASLTVRTRRCCARGGCSM